jgi:hypothetical protein
MGSSPSENSSASPETEIEQWPMESTFDWDDQQQGTAEEAVWNLEIPGEEGDNFADADADPSTDGKVKDGVGKKVEDQVVLSPGVKSAICIVTVLYGSCTGFIGGAGIGALESLMLRAAQKEAFTVRAMLLNAVQNGKQLAGLFGVYLGARCTLKAVRGKDDRLNIFTSGFLGGLVYGLKYRQPKVVLASGVLTGIALTFLDGGKQDVFT